MPCFFWEKKAVVLCHWPWPLPICIVACLIHPRSEQLEPSLFGEAEVEIKLPATPDEADAWMAKAGFFFKSASNGASRYSLFLSRSYHKKPGTPPLSTDYIAEWREFIQTVILTEIFTTGCSLLVQKTNREISPRRNATTSSDKLNSKKF